MTVALPERYAALRGIPPPELPTVLARERLIPFTKLMYGPGYRAGRHHHLIADVLERAARGQLPRVVISVPPRHGKSELASVHFPAWYLGRYPDNRIIACSYAANLAYRFSRRARNMLIDPRWPFPEVIPAGDSRNVSAWDVDGRKGGYVAAGVGGSITGFGANCLLIDDPVKNQEEADSLTIQDRNWEWFQSTAMTRVEPGGSVILIGTRWHEADLIGRAVADNPDGWHVINLPAICESDSDVLNRELGAALWPEQWNEEALRQRREAVGERTWNALFQQRPAPSEGATFQRGWWRRFPDSALPRMATVEIAVDSAFKAGVSSDYSAIETWGADGNGDYYLLDVVRARLEFPELVRAVHDAHAAAAARFPHLTVPVVIEDAASGQSAVQVLSRAYRTPEGALLPALPVIPWKIGSVSKVARAESVSPLVEAGRVHLPESAPWVGAFVEEAATFPFGAHDDQVDAMGIGLARLSRPKPQGVWSV